MLAQVDEKLSTFEQSAKAKQQEEINKLADVINVLERELQSQKSATEQILIQNQQLLAQVNNNTKPQVRTSEQPRIATFNPQQQLADTQLLLGNNKSTTVVNTSPNKPGKSTTTRPANQSKKIMSNVAPWAPRTPVQFCTAVSKNPAIMAQPKPKIIS